MSMTVDELMSLADVYADARGFYLRHIHSPPNIAANRVAGDKLRAALEAVVADAERYAWLRENAPGLVCQAAWRVPAACLYGDPDAAIDTARSAGAKGGV